MTIRVSIIVLATLLLLSSGCSKSARLDRHLARADKALLAGDYDAARIEYLNAHRIDRTHPRAITQLAMIYYDMGSPRQAIPFLLRARELYPDNIEIRFRLALLLAKGDREKAREEVNAILAEQPAHPEAPLVLTDLIRSLEEIQTTRAILAALQAKTGETATLLTAEAMLSLRGQSLQEAESFAERAVALDPKFAPGHLTLAIIRLSQTNLDEADRHFQKVIDASPLRSERQIRYLEFKRDTGALDESRQMAEALAAQAPDYLPAWQFLAQLAFDQRQFNESRNYLERILNRDPANYDANVLGARIQLAQDQSEQALARLEQLATLYPNTAELHHQLALASLLNRDAVKAHRNASQAVQLDPDAIGAVLLLARLDMARGDWDAAINGLIPVLAKQPSNPRITLELAQAYRGKGRLDDALGLYQDYLHAAPGDPQGPFHSGMLLRQLGRPAEARTQFEKVLQLDPRSLPATQQLVELDLLANQQDAAMHRVKGLVESHPDSAPARLLLAQVHFHHHDLADAEVELKKALELDPDSREAQVLLARVYVASNRQNQALEELNTLLERNPSDTAAWLLIGTIHGEAKAYDQAIAAYEKAVSLNPDFVPALNNLAYLYASLSRDARRADELARHARSLRPDDPAVADTLGWVRFQSGEYHEALALFLEGAAKLPGEPELLYHLGAAHYMLGQEQPARAALSAALTSELQFQGRADAQQRLNILDLDTRQPDPQSQGFLESRLREQPRDLIALLRLAALQEAAGAVDSAIQAYSQAVEISPRALSPCLRLAQLYARRSQDHDQALRLARRARELAPTDPAVASILGRLIFQAGDHAWSLSLLQEAARQIRDDPELLYDLAWAQYSVGQVLDALATMRQAKQSQLPPAHAEIANDFIELAALHNHPTTAGIDRARQILDSRPDFVPALMVTAWINAQSDRTVLARQAAEKVLTIYPFFNPAHRLLSVLYLKDPPDHEKAYTHAVKARAAYPDDPLVSKSLGMALYLRNEYRQAVQLLRASTAGNDADPESYLYLGMAYHRLGETQSSRDALQKVMSLETPASIKEQANRLMESMDR